MPALYPSRTGIYIQKIVCRVILDHEYVGMSADEYIWSVALYKCPRLVVIPARPASYVYEQNLLAFPLEASVFWVIDADVLSVTVAIYPYKWLKCGNTVYEIDTSPEVSGMPDLIDRGEEVLEFLAEDPVSIGYYSYVHSEAYFIG